MLMMFAAKQIMPFKVGSLFEVAGLLPFRL